MENLIANYFINKQKTFYLLHEGRYVIILVVLFIQLLVNYLPQEYSTIIIIDYFSKATLMNDNF
jgi:hypothetical protein